jgi:tyrocidine synthetase-3
MRANDHELQRNAKLIASQKIRERDYWLRKLSGDIEKSYFPYDYRIKDSRRMKTVKFSFGGELFSQLMKLSNASDIRLFVILTAGLAALLDKYTGKKDILLGAPIYKQDAQGEFINTILPLRNQVREKMTFKDLVITVSQTIKEANENQNYPLEILLEQLNMSMSGDSVPLFDAAVLLQNIHDKAMITHVNFNMIVAFLRREDALEGELEYNASLYRKTTIERIIKHFTGFLQRAVLNPSSQTADIDILTEREKGQLLIDFNDTRAEYPRDKTIHELFARHVEITPDNIAVVFEDGHLSYRELHEQSNRLARVLRGKGVKTDTNVGIMVERSIEMIVGILAILKAGAAYLPVNVESPAKRVEYMLDDGNVPVLLAKSSIIKNDSFVQLQGEQKGVAREIVMLDLLSRRLTGSGFNLDHNGHASDLAYTIYTSGSTGKPKGVLVEHRNVVRLVKNTNFVDFSEGNRILPTGALDFDASTFEIWGALINGLRLHLTAKENILTPGKLKATIRTYDITLVWFTAPLFNYLVEADIDIFSGLRSLVVGGDALSPAHIEKVRVRYPGLKLINGYGPTENTTFSTTFLIEEEYKENVPIGRPINNSKAYILGKKEELQPPGAAGELYVGGDGVSRGYLNSPGLTFEKFAINPFMKGGRVYRTGDLARWLPDGNIEFLGRLDQQVKIRGYRIELGEIESKLSTHKEIKNNVVIAGSDESGNKFLVAYIVPRSPGSVESLAVPELREYLAGDFPDYMIPSYFVLLDEIPLTLNGKVDRKALPPYSVKTDAQHESPRDETEEKLAEIWSNVLGLDKEIINIDMSFFEWGGHSLNATMLISKLHQAFDVKIPLVELFIKPTIRELAEYVRGFTVFADRFLSIGAVEEKEYYPLSSAQKRLYVLQQFELAGTGYNVVQTVALEGALDKDRLEATFEQLIQRHESLRTSFEMINEEPVQIIHHEVEFEIEYYDLAANKREETRRRKENHHLNQSSIINHFVRTFDLSKAPLMRVLLIRLRDREYTLMMDMHHIITDGTSTGIFAGEFMALYEGRDLPELQLQYKDFASWQKSLMESGEIKEQEEFWQTNFDDEIPVLLLPYDYDRPVSQSFEGNSMVFAVTDEETAALRNLGQEENATLFMVLLGLFNILLSKLSGQEDIVVGTPLAGRRHADLQSVIGMFVNTLALRNHPTGEKSFAAFLKEVKEKALKSFENQDYQFEDLVEHAAVNRDMGRNPLFDVMLSLQNMDIPKIEIPGLTLKPYSNTSEISKFDLTLYAIEGPDNLAFRFEYCTKLFKESTIERFKNYFKKIIADILEDRGRKLSDIEIITEVEKHRLLFEFNDTKADYPEEKTIHELFEEQAERRPDGVAVNGLERRAESVEQIQITYCELNRRSNQLAYLLRQRGVQPDTIVGIMMERSLEMIIGIMGILKAGGAYLPIDPDYPQDRSDYMLKDSEARILLASPAAQVKVEVKVKEKEVEVIDIDSILFSSTSTSTCQVSSANLAYVIYTSGSTGRPKGVMIRHQGVVNYITWAAGMYVKDERLNFPLYSAISFDLTVTSLFIPLLTGNSIVIYKEDEKELLIEKVIREDRVGVVKATPSHLKSISYKTFNNRNIKRFIVGGENFESMLARKLDMNFSGNVEIYNEYGPTETVVGCMIYRFDPQKTAAVSVPIGIPAANTRIYILNDYLKPVPVGFPGELFIGGDGVARGYLNQPELTAERFFYYRSYRSNKTYISQKIYKTGDLARFLWDGNIEFIGRIDHQVKIRGFRIESGEIEAQLLAHAEIKEAVVLALSESSNGSNGGDKYLCAYIVSNAELTASELREYLSKYLCGYMIPSYFVFMDEIPLTSTGKINRNALPAPGVTLEDKYVAPANELEKKLEEIWSDILGLEKKAVGVESDFFKLGGHSLRATVMTSVIHQELDVEIPLAEIFKTPTIRALSNFINKMEKTGYMSIEPREEKEYYPLSFAQRRLWVLCQFEADSTAYNIPGVLELYGIFNADTFQETLQALVDRHESLRTVFITSGGEPKQRILKDVTVNLQQTDLRELDYAEKEKKGKDIYVAAASNVFHLENGPLFLFKLVRLENDKYLLIYNIHHIVSDGWSQGVINNEVVILYNAFSENKKNPLPPLELQYKDYTIWHNGRIDGGNFDKSGQYWMEKFKDKPNGIELPTDHSRKAIQTFNGGRIQATVDKEIISRLIQLCRQQDVTLFMGLLALFSLFLHKYTGEKDIIIGSPIAGRKHRELHGMIGFLVNTLIYRNMVDPAENVVEFLGRVKKETLESYEYQDYPFDLLVERLELDRDLSQSPIFNVMLAHNNADIEDDKLIIEGLGASDYVHGSEFNMSKFDLTCFMDKRGDALQIFFEYNSDLFECSTAGRMTANLVHLLECILNNPQTPIAELDYMDRAEYEKVVELFNRSDYAFPPITVQELVERQVEKIPEKTAVIGLAPGPEPWCEPMPRITYRELNRKANQLAHYLREEYQVKPNDIIGVFLDRSIEMVTAILGVIKSGAGYVAIDPNYPQDRIRHMLEDSESQWVITDRENPPLLEGYDGEVINIDCARDKIGLESVENPRLENKAEDIVYVIYTSGSTGMPNGAMLSQGILSNLIQWQKEVTTIDTSLRCLQFTSINFCVSFQEILVTLGSGGEIHLIGDVQRQDIDYLMNFLSGHRIEILYLPFSYLNFLFNESSRWGESFEHSLKHIITAGEQLKITAGLRKFLQTYPQLQLHNHYGSSEMHVVTSYTLDASTVGQMLLPPAGRPIANTRIYILDEDERVVPIGVWGELCIAGSAEVSGYVNNLKLTDKKLFLHRELSERNDGKRLYRSGDIGRWQADGNIELKGRKDFQVKIRGFRVEPGEIESKISLIAGVRDCVVVVKEGGEGKYLAAYVVAEGIDGREISRTISGYLPQHMIPTLVLLDAIPLMPNGKVDRESLPEPELGVLEEYVGPRDDVDEVLLEIWSEILGAARDKISIDINFFDMGGHSLKATLVVSTIHKRLGKKVPLAEMFKRPTIRELSDYIKRAKDYEYSPIEPVEEKEAYGLSSAQKRLYVLQQMEPDNISYNMPQAVILEGRTGKEKLESTFRKLIRRHESLRTSFHIVGEETVQRIHEKNSKFQILNSRLHTNSRFQITNIIKDFVRPFDFSQAPLLRAGLIRLEDEKHILMVDMHHIITDGTSTGIFAGEFMALYEGRDLPELKLQYRDFASWQNSLMESGEIKEQEEFWQTNFDDEIPVLLLPCDYDRPVSQSFEGNSMVFAVTDEETAALRNLGQGEDATLFMVLLGLFNILLSKLSGQEDIVVGTPLAGRRHADLQSVVGMFVNTLALPNQPDGEKTFSVFLKEIKENTLKAFENQDYQFEDLVEHAGVNRDMGRNPLFDVMLSLQNLDIPKIEIPGLKLKPYGNTSEISKFDLTLYAIEGPDSLAFRFEYCTKLFKESTIERFKNYFKKIITDVVEDRDRKLSDIEIITGVEKHRLLFEFNDTKAGYPEEKTIHELFEVQVEKIPKAAAVVDSDFQTFTYIEFNRRVNQLAHILEEKGVTRETLVGIMVGRSLEMMVGIFAILKAGGAYLPIDPQNPPARIQYLLEDSEARLLLTRGVFADKTGTCCETIDLDDARLFNGEDKNPEKVNEPADLCYVIYTSGSTGEPKGVMIEHGSLVNRLNWMQRYFSIGSGDVVLQKTVYTFDVSVWELFWWSLHGASLFLLAPGGEKDPGTIVEAIATNKITTMHFVPSMLNAFLDYLEIVPEIEKLSGLKQVFASGEALEVYQVERFNKMLYDKIGTRLINLYGPTEATIDVSYFNCSTGETFGKIPIGKPIDNIHLYIVDKALKLQPMGVPGELCIGGVGVARGYLKRERLTLEKFLESPFIKGERLYRSGDLARWLPDENGNIEFLGRIDHQVKIRGFRIESGEIEGQLVKHKAVKQAVVVAKQDETADTYLCAYFVSSGSSEESSKNTLISELKKYLTDTLPDYMIPIYFVRLDGFPLTGSGKINRRALPEPEAGNLGEVGAYAAPRDEMEEKLADIWSEVLGMEKEIIGIDSNFFQLGGHSLKATIMVSNLHKIFNVKVPLTEIFKAPTIRGLSQYINTSLEDRFIAIKPVEEKEYYPLSSAQKRLFILQQMDRQGISYNMPLGFPLEESMGVDRLENVFRELIRRHESLRTSFEIINGKTVQKIHAAVRFKIKHYHLKEGIGKDTVISNFIRPFDLTRAPLLRVGVIQIGTGRILLMVDMHHIISDGVSHDILVRDFMALDNGETLPPLRLQYRDFAQWQDTPGQKKIIETQETYWLKEFGGTIPLLDMPGDYVRSADPAFKGGTLFFKIVPTLTRKIKELASRLEVTLLMFLISIYKILLSKYTGQEDIVVGTVIAGRRHEDLQNIIGFFVNMLALKTSPGENKTFPEFIMELKEKAVQAYENQEYPFEELVSRLHIQREPGRHPLIDTVFVLQDAPGPGKRTQKEPGQDSGNLNPRKITHFDLMLHATVTADSINMVFEYSTTLFKTKTIERISKFYLEILEQVVENNTIKLGEIKASRELVPVESNVLRDSNLDFDF